MPSSYFNVRVQAYHSAGRYEKLCRAKLPSSGFQIAANGGIAAKIRSVSGDKEVPATATVLEQKRTRLEVAR